MMLRILHVLNFNEIGGIESRLIDFFESTNLEHRFSVFSPRPIPVYWQEKLKSLTVPFQYGSGKKPWEKELVEYARTFRTDIAHFHQPWPKAKSLLKNAGIKIILEHDHGAVWLHSSKEIQADKKNRKVVNGVIAVSNAGRKMLIKRMGYNPKKITVIYNGVNFNRLKSNAPVPRPIGKKIVTTACRLRAVKGIDSFIKAIPLIVKKRNDIVFWVVGDGRLYKNMKNLASKLGVKDQIRFWGKQRQIGNFLASTDLFVLPSIREPLGGVLIEAGFFGIPCIAANVDGNPEIIKNGKTGILITPTIPVEKSVRKKTVNFPKYVIHGQRQKLSKPLSIDPKKLAKVIIKLLSQPKHCQTMGQKARKHIVKNFGVERYRKNLNRYYDSIWRKVNKK